MTVTSIDLRDANSIINFGSGPQAELRRLSQKMISGVHDKTSAPVEQDVMDMMGILKGFKVTPGNMTSEPTLIGRLLGKSSPMGALRRKCADVKMRIRTIADNLENHKTDLMADIKDLDKLYDLTLISYQEIERHIEDGESYLTSFLEDAQSGEGEAPQSEIAVQEMNDLRAAADDLERRLHDLRLTRQVIMQSLPSIRLVQQNDKALIRKITSILSDTLPLWEANLAQVISIDSSQKVLSNVMSNKDLMNPDKINSANDHLIAELEGGFKAAHERKAKRIESETSLKIAQDQHAASERLVTSV